MRAASLRAAALLCALVLAVGLGAQDASEPVAETSTVAESSTDALFDDPAVDVVAPEGPKVDLSPLFSVPKPTFGGSITSTFGGYVGWHDRLHPTRPLYNLGYGFGYEFSRGLSLDYRPDPTFHWAASLGSSIPAGGLSWSTPSIGSMYVDYTLLDTVFLTFGRFGASWGIGRLFGVNDLLSPLGGSMAVKAFAPVGPLAVTTVAMLAPGAATLDAVSWAGQVETSWQSLNFALGSLYVPKADLKFDASVKTVLWGADVFTEAKVVVPQAGITGMVPLQALAGFYWEGGDPKFHIQGEWTASALDLTWADQSVAVGFGWSSIPGTNWKPQAKVTYALIDNSFQMIFGLETDVLPHVHLTLGAPISWGDPTSRWVMATTSEYHEAWALAAKIDLSGGF